MPFVSVTCIEYILNGQLFILAYIGLRRAMNLWELYVVMGVHVTCQTKSWETSCQWNWHFLVPVSLTMSSERKSVKLALKKLLLVDSIFDHLWLILCRPMKCLWKPGYTFLHQSKVLLKLCQLLGKLYPEDGRWFGVLM